MKHLSEMVEAARARGRKRLAVAYGQDAHTIEAVYDAYNEGLVEATLFGDKEVIEKTCAELGIDVSVFGIVDEKNPAKAVAAAVKAVASNEADVLMKGLVSTDVYMRGIIKEGLLPPKGTLSHVSVFEWAGYHKLLLASDIAVLPLPDLKTKQTLIKYLADVARTLEIPTPKIACISAMELVNANIPSMAEAAILAKMGDRG
ncbi:MAG: phosphate butyryltransferase, partial [Alistipes sp.]|nr:phosphate butyryltransferase [Alistipes sp.]